MTKGTFFVLLIAPAFILGCGAPPPQHQDPLAGLYVKPSNADSPYKDLTLALITSKNTTSAIDYIVRARERPSAGSHNLQLIPEDGILIGGFTAIFQRDFRSVVRIDRVDEAKGVNEDMVAVLDLFVEKLPENIWPDARFQAGLTLMSPDGAQLDLVKAESRKNPRSFKGMPNSQRVYSAIKGAAEETQQKLESGLLASTALREFARSITPAPSKTAARPAVAALAPSIRSDVDTPSYRLSERPDDFALIIGVEKYSNDLPDAQFAERDAEAVKKHLLALGYPERNIKLLTGSRAVRSSMTAYLEDWLPRNIKKNSRMFFYFSGHGAPSPESGQAYLVPWDGNPNFLDKTAYSVKKLYSDLGALKAKQVIVALDSCFSGAGGRSILADGARPLVNLTDAAVAPGAGILLFAAASPKEITSTLKDQGHGIFTYFL